MKTEDIDIKTSLWFIGGLLLIAPIGFFAMWWVCSFAKPDANIKEFRVLLEKICD